jgi:RNase adaptor protein for sRNA GlmZ degradation
MEVSFHRPHIVLNMITHAHSPPLRPAPPLKYDLRTVPKPPKAIRDAYTGVSKRLKDHMLEHEAFVELLERAEAEIRAKMDDLIEGWGQDNEALRNDEGDVAPEEYDNDEGKSDNGDYNTRNDKAEDQSEVQGPIAQAIENEPMDVILTVGISCARGQHRSVAFAEELSRKDWPKQWEIRLEHRDLGQKRGGAKNHTGRDCKIRGADLFNDE